MDRAAAVELVHGLVAIPSLSRQEAAASAWLAEQMRAAGYERAFVDEAGNAVGELGDPSAPRTIVLLGHIDTVPGNIPVRIEPSADGDVLLRPRQRRRQGPARHVRRRRARGSAQRGARRRPPRRRRRRGGRRSGHEQGRAVHRGALRRHARADSDRVHHRRAEPLASRHARLQGPAAARPHRRSADGAHRGPRCQRRRRSSSISGTGSPPTPRASTTARTRPSIS